MEHLRKLITHRIRDASTDITTTRIGSFDALVSPHVLVLHTKSAVNGPGLTKLLEQAKTKDVLRPTVFLVCKLVSALKKTIKDRAADHDIDLHVLTSHTGAFFSLLAVGVDAFRLPQMPATVMRCPARRVTCRTRPPCRRPTRWPSCTARGRATRCASSTARAWTWRTTRTAR